MRIWRCVLAGGVQRSSLSVKRTVPAFTGAEASATACPATVGVFASTGLAIIKSRLCRRKAAKVGVPVGHGYNYFLACDAAERIIFAIVAGSGSGKLCWHSRGNDNDQKNAGYVRESAGGSEQALRAEEVQKRSFCRRSFPHFFRCWKKWGRRRQRKRLRRGAK